MHRRRHRRHHRRRPPAGSDDAPTLPNTSQARVKMMPCTAGRGNGVWGAGGPLVGLPKGRKTDAPELLRLLRRWEPSGRLCEREGARGPSLRSLRRPLRAAAARGSSRPAPRTCVTGSASSPDEQTSAPSFAQRLTAGLGAVAPGIGVSESGCTAVTAADTPNPGSPAPETPLAPQRSLLSSLVCRNPERSRGGAHDSASLAEALRTAARHHVHVGARHVIIKAPGAEPLQPAPPGLLQNL